MYIVHTNKFLEILLYITRVLNTIRTSTLNLSSVRTYHKCMPSCIINMFHGHADACLSNRLYVNMEYTLNLTLNAKIFNQSSCWHHY